MDDENARLGNLITAFATGVSDRVRTAMGERSALGGEALGAIIVIGSAAGLSIDRLGKVLRLSHPGTVRLVDRLIEAGYAERRAALTDRRAVAIHLTEAGQAERTALLAIRAEALEPLLGRLDASERTLLDGLLEKMLLALPSDATSAMTVCRFCRHERCAACPMDSFGALDGTVRRQDA
ncbi:MarR family transcriptional regulator [Massilia sp. KIM]|uniref:MarR family winged helix-turn-helix transcriptional regulator n=1 Tax=Massilia sp. KIM TaxID=1955422 RepID=UPI00098F6CD8|nr:MarR family transcriptional regulator [Massilia sp. KIM]OON61146.1 MarR family transcriptional regulator [Massilia sp. KIM]